jgi:hypothetical protein
MFLPVAGFAVFAILYVTGSFFYPGGSQADSHSVGFSWFHNYWCNLLAEKAINGQPNPARYFAYPAMIILCLSLMLFWILFFQETSYSATQKRIFQISGILSSIISFFLFTGYHDSVINAAGIFGLIALFGALVYLYRQGRMFLFSFGILNLLLMGLNNLLYHSGNWYYLPLVQKITFVSFLIWLGTISIVPFRREGPKAL